MSYPVLPVVDPTALGIYLNDPNIDPVRAAALIADAQTLCESVVNPLPIGADVIVKRVAGRAYVTITSPRQAQLAAAGSPIGGGGGMGGVFLTQYDERDLRRMTTGSGTFIINLLSAGYAPPPSWAWDSPSGAWDSQPAGFV